MNLICYIVINFYVKRCHNPLRDNTKNRIYEKIGHLFLLIKKKLELMYNIQTKTSIVYMDFKHVKMADCQRANLISFFMEAFAGLVEGKII